MEDIIIDRANLDDVQGICSLYDDVANLHAEALPEIFTYGSNREPKEIIDLLSDEKCAVLVARLQCHVIGVAVGVLKESFSHPSLVKRRFGWIEALAVKEEYRSKGIGRKLINHLHDWFLSQGIKRIELNVYEFNDTAIKLYEKLGYSAIRRVLSIDL